VLNENKIAALLHRIAVLEEALKPFADHARFEDSPPLTVEDWQRAEAASPDRSGLNLGEILSNLKSVD
jgi:hypothetical protein